MNVQSDSMLRMHGKLCLVTGATSGIGAVAAAALARQGATVMVVGRDPQRSADTVERIKRQTGNPSVDFLLADLSSQREVRQMAEQFTRQYARLDVLVNNAGAAFTRRRVSVDGLEMTFALNHLSYFLLTLLLLDTLKASAPSRIVNVSSGVHVQAHIDFDDLQGARHYNGLDAYRQSKLANLLFTYELVRQLDGAGVTVNALHPGLVATGLWTNNGLAGRLLRRVLDLRAISAEEGARTTIYLATAPEVAQVTGRYFVKEQPVESSPASLDEQAARRLWQVSLEMTGL